MKIYKKNLNYFLSLSRIFFLLICNNSSGFNILFFTSFTFYNKLHCNYYFETKKKLNAVTTFAEANGVPTKNFVPGFIINGSSNTLLLAKPEKIFNFRFQISQLNNQNPYSLWKKFQSSLPTITHL